LQAKQPSYSLSEVYDFAKIENKMNEGMVAPYLKVIQRAQQKQDEGVQGL
jgi:hypothetical protein